MRYIIPEIVQKHIETTGESIDTFMNRAISETIQRDRKYNSDFELPYYAVVDVKPKTNFTLLLTFANGDQRIFNATMLKDNTFYENIFTVNNFLCACICGVTVVWADKYGMFQELPPQFLYDNSVSIETDDLKPAINEVLLRNKAKQRDELSSTKKNTSLPCRSEQVNLDNVCLPTEFINSVEQSKKDKI
ncbi:MAG: hypothetical protein ACI4HO_03860 [Ruminococcus sp.]